LNSFGDIIGKICKTLIPIPEEVYFGNTDSSISLCTLSSINLLKKIANSNLMNSIFVVGRLLSENKGIDSLIQNVVSNSNTKIIIICGNEVSGHLAGHSLLALHKNGINYDGKILESHSPEPILKVSKKEIDIFRNQVQIINKIGTTNFSDIKKLVNSLKN
jgi:tetrahydromethanopterin S-methyltransferase subunit A